MSGKYRRRQYVQEKVARGENREIEIRKYELRDSGEQRRHLETRISETRNIDIRNFGLRAIFSSSIQNPEIRASENCKFNTTRHPNSETTKFAHAEDRTFENRKIELRAIPTHRNS